MRTQPRIARRIECQRISMVCGKKALEWISVRTRPGSGEKKKKKKKERKIGIVRKNRGFQRDRITESCTEENDPPQAFSALCAIGKHAFTGAFRCVGSNSLRWELFITRLMPRLEHGDLRNSSLCKVERILS